VAVTQFTLAVDRSFKPEGGEREADFIPIVVWRQAAEACANYLRKGRLTAVEGRIQVRNYENNEGKRVYVTEVIADNVRFLEKAESNERPDVDRAPSGNTYQRNTGSNDPFSGDGKPIDISVDDLPF